jgi:D-glycero-alpha-D-manno-heptose 1-phosphate guanylyltransferase
MEAIILAGGLGTRLASVLTDRPKALALVRGEPFLTLLIRRLGEQGFRRAIIATGHLGEQIRANLGSKVGPVETVFSQESQPLGTGGATRLAIKLARSSEVFVMNGDTWVDLDYKDMLAFHRGREARVTVAVAEVADTARYGSLEMGNETIVRFGEKSGSGRGIISAGNYLLNRDVFDSFTLPKRFSIEKDFFEAHLADLKPAAFRAKGRFIDIGIPDDLMRAQSLCESPEHLPPDART